MEILQGIFCKLQTHFKLTMGFKIKFFIFAVQIKLKIKKLCQTLHQE